jgi:hypothetical protein
VDNTGLASFGNSSGTGDANFQFASDSNAWTMGYYSADKTFRIASSTNLNANVYFQIGKSGTTTLNSGLGTGTGGNYLCIDTTTFEIVRGNGAACTASSVRFKDNVRDLIYGLSDVMRLRPVSFTYKPEMNSGTSTHLGFIAEEVQPIIPELVTYNNNGEIQGLDYPTVSAVLTKAIQEVNYDLLSIASSTASTTPASNSFAEGFFSNLFAHITDWLASATNGIGDFFANRVRTKQLCISDDTGETCITKAKLDTLIAGAALPSSGGTSGGTSPASSGTTSSASTPPVDTQAPVITMGGNNPATVNVGTTYVDLGATVTDNVDNNLGISVSVDGGVATTLDQVVIDTSIAGTHTIVYSATDQAGNIGTASRGVDVVDPTPAPSPSPTETISSSGDATTTTP